MRKACLLLFGMVLAGITMPAGAGELNRWVPHQFTTMAPCAVACPYWLDTANNDLDGDDREDVRFDACGNPDGTDGSLSDVPGLPWEKGVVYDELEVGPPPEGAVILIVDGGPSIDWDLFLCSDERDVAVGCSAAGREECVLGDNCDNAIGPQNPVPIGCQERVVTNAVAERIYTIRAYNFSDPLPLQIRYCWSRSGSCH